MIFSTSELETSCINGFILVSNFTLVWQHSGFLRHPIY